MLQLIFNSAEFLFGMTLGTDFVVNSIVYYLLGESLLSFLFLVTIFGIGSLTIGFFYDTCLALFGRQVFYLGSLLCLSFSIGFLALEDKFLCVKYLAMFWLGLTRGGVVTLTFSMILHFFEEEKMARIMRLNFFFYLGMTFGPIFSGLIQDYTDRIFLSFASLLFGSLVLLGFSLWKMPPKSTLNFPSHFYERGEIHKVFLEKTFFINLVVYIMATTLLRSVQLIFSYFFLFERSVGFHLIPYLYSFCMAAQIIFRSIFARMIQYDWVTYRHLILFALVQMSVGLFLISDYSGA